MGIETGTTISALNDQWPLDTDPTHEGNDHLQLIKSVLKSQFPGRDDQGQPESGFDIPITATPEEINFLEGVDGNVQDAIDNLDGLIRRVVDTVEVGQDDASMLLRTNGENAVVQTWDDPENPGTPLNATVMNSLNVVDLLYPIGTYIDRDGTAPDPNVQYTGTTWEPVVGYVTVGAGIVDEGGENEETYTVDTTGGSSTHTLTEAEMPSHTHQPQEGEGASVSGSNTFLWAHSGGDSSGNSIVSTATGGDEAHNNMQPYIVVNKWKRTA